MRKRLLRILEKSQGSSGNLIEMGKTRRKKRPTEQASKLLNHAERFQVRLPGVYSLRIHGFTAGNRRTGQYRARAVPTGPVPASTVFVLRAEARPDQGVVLGGGRVSAVV